MSEVRGQRSEVGSQKSEVRSQKSEVRSQKSEVRSQRSCFPHCRWKTEAGYTLGRCCLMITDHLLSKKQERAIAEGTSLQSFLDFTKRHTLAEKLKVANIRSDVEVGAHHTNFRPFLPLEPALILA